MFVPMVLSHQEVSALETLAVRSTHDRDASVQE